ncbi:MAG: DNA ligase D [Sandaracinaceae bacterium]|nr:DNA ligase D [Sandaracinaceae bacterium]
MKAKRSLSEYWRKRDFKKTAEPRGTVEKLKKQPRYFIQKHAARALHYDFRLELDGVLRSWAVPKGPSVIVGEKRLAVEVEDHPISYGNFSGTIPKGEYGAGTVEVWDRGHFTPLEDPGKALKKGHFRFRLDGERLHGEWSLVRTSMSGGGKTNWLLLRRNDSQLTEAAPPASPTKQKATKDKALKSVGKRTLKPALPKLKRLADVEWHHQLATLADGVPESTDYLFETKFDGYRAFCFIEQGKAHFQSRNGKDWTARLPTLNDAASKLKVKSAVIDGELVALKENGVSDFQRLQNALSEGLEGELVFYAFDLLALDGEDLRDLPLRDRKARLHKIIGKSKRIRYSAEIDGDGREILKQACKLGLEGIIAKVADGAYEGRRSTDWLKLKCQQRQEFVIVGYTEPQGARSGFGALLLGIHKDGKLVYSGKTKTGFSDRSLMQLQEKLKKLERKTRTVDDAPRMSGVHWVKPILVAEIRYSEITNDGRLRHPAFEGLREDKKARSVKPEKTMLVKEKKIARASKPATKSQAPAKRAKEAAGEIVVTHPERVVFKNGFTKGDVFEYYKAARDRIFPYIEGRPLALVRCPRGVGSACFYQKHPSEINAAGLESANIREKHADADNLIVTTKDGVLAAAQLGALEIHTWGSRVEDIEHPDQIVLDFDPAPDVAWSRVVEAARTLKGMLDKMGLPSFVKWAGGKGLHVVVPLVPEHAWDTTHAFTRLLADTMVQNEPVKYIATMSKAKRTGKIFIDYFRNGRGSLVIAPYSVRAREGAPVSVPLAWKELSPTKPPFFDIKSVRARLKKPDPWKDFWKSAVRLGRLKDIPGL